MNFTKTFDIFKMTVESELMDLEDTYEIPEERLSVIEENCERIDELVHLFDALSIECELDVDSEELTISLITPGFEMEHDANHPFLKVISDASVFYFKALEGKDIQVSFVFDNVIELK